MSTYGTQIHKKAYMIRDDINFNITNFPFLCSNISASLAYDVFISQLIRYARVCSPYGCFILRATRLSNKLLQQGYAKERLKSSLQKFYCPYGDSKFFSHERYMTFCSLTKTMTTLHRSDFILIRDLT